jgi:hypothetical protein
VIGQGQGGHAHLFGALDQLLDIAEAVEQGVFRMDVQVNKGHGNEDVEQINDAGENSLKS